MGRVNVKNEKEPPSILRHPPVFVKRCEQTFSYPPPSKERRKGKKFHKINGTKKEKRLT